MEPRDRAAQALSAAGPTGRAAPAGPSPRTRTRTRLAATCVLLVALAFVQDPGLLVADTKLDLVLDPGRFLGRALNLWDPDSAFGQLQNQAYGYLWPMGPFFLLGDLLGLPGWVVQRGWWALLLCTAFLGAALLVRALGVRRDLAVVVGGLAYALSPRVLTVIGPISIEAWPSALAPWVLLPLVLGSRRGSPVRAAALSALAVAMVGGVNAAATFAVIPLGAVWLLTREPGPRRRSLMLWWPVFTAMGTLWWLVPLFTLGAYSPPFLDFIESATITTFPTTPFDALRGTSNWVPFVSTESRAGNDLLRQGHLAVMSGVLLAGGLVGMALRRQPHRWFLAVSLGVGLVMVTAGHQGAVQGLFAGGINGLLDGVLAPLRNVHKFDPVVRLPLVVGLAWTVQALVEARVPRAQAVDRAVSLGVVVLAVALAASPALATRLAPGGAFPEVPAHWSEAASWLEAAQQEDDGTALLVPGSAFGSYQWGEPRDEPMQALGRVSWAVRNQVPLTPPGGIRALDRVEQAMAQGDGSAALTAGLQRLGVRWLLLRRDLRADDDLPDPVLVEQALAASPGLRPVAQFGAEVGGAAHLVDGDGVRSVVNGGWQRSAPAIVIWEVDAPRPRVTTTSEPTVVVGGPEDVYDLEALGVVGTGATVLAPDAGEGPAGTPWVLTDGLRERERSFARVHDGSSPVVLPGDVRRTSNQAVDYLSPAQEGWRTRGAVSGVASVAASSSASDATALGGARRGRLPFAALDGDPTTQWSADPADEEQDSWSVGLAVPTSVPEVGLVGGQAADADQRVVVRTATGESDPVPLGPGERTRVTLPGGGTDRVSVLSVGPTGTPMALAEVELPGVEAVRRLDLPRVPASWGVPDAVVLRGDLDPRTGCAVVDGDVRCLAREARESEEAAGSARRFVLAGAAEYEVDLRVRPRPGPALDGLLAASQPVLVETSSVGVPDPRASGLAAVDGAPGTAWVADEEDPAPTLRLSWLEPQRITGLEVGLDPDTPAARPTTVTLRAGEQTREVVLGTDGAARFAPLTAQNLEVRLTEVEQAYDLDPESGGRELPAGVGELRLSGADSLPLAASGRSVTRDCGSGPDLVVDGTTYPTAVRASDADLVAGRSVPVDLCGGDGDRLELSRGVVDVAVASTEDFQLASLVLRRPGAPTLAAERDRPAESTASGLAATRHNANPGWRATLDGRAVPTQVVDGWRQGYAVPDTAGPLETSYGPDALYRAGLLAGAAALLGLLVVVAVLRGRPHPHAREHPAVLARAPRRVSVAVLTVVVALLVAGVPGLVLAGLGAGAASLLAPRGRAAVALLVAAPLLASAAYLWRPWGTFATWAGELAWPSYLVLLPVLGVLWLGPPDRRRR